MIIDQQSTINQNTKSKTIQCMILLKAVTSAEMLVTFCTVVVSFRILSLAIRLFLVSTASTPLSLGGSGGKMFPLEAV